MPADWAISARDRIVARLDSFLHQGSVVAQPEDPAQCVWCDFAGACRVEQLPALVQIARLNDGLND